MVANWAIEWIFSNLCWCVGGMISLRDDINLKKGAEDRLLMMIQD